MTQPRKKYWRGEPPKAQGIVTHLLSFCLKAHRPRIYHVEPLTFNDIGRRGWYDFRIERFDWSDAIPVEDFGTKGVPCSEWYPRGFQNRNELRDALGETNLPDAVIEDLLGQRKDK
jgi:hypothetical protein